LVCQISQDPLTRKSGQVNLSFHFGLETNSQQSAGSGGFAARLMNFDVTASEIILNSDLANVSPLC
jgi:hypothetical protein